MPRLPTLSLLAHDYTHCLKEISLGAGAQAASTSTTSSLDFFQQMASKAANGLLPGALLDEFWSNVMSRVDAHLMPSYKAGLAALSKG